jgi:hypothetical protein
VIEGEDLELFEQSLRQAIERNTGAELDAALAAVGWNELLQLDARAAVSLLFELQGRAGATSSALDHVLAAALGREAGAVLLPAIGEWKAPGELVGSRLGVRGIGTSGIDPWLGMVQATGEIRDFAEAGRVDWEAVVAAGQRALGHELVGASRRMLELARQHALDRIQFGQPIARFQAIRHRLAETLIAIEMAEAVLEAAWLDRSPEIAAMAKAIAGRSSRAAARHCQQVLAGIGFTTEHELHRHVRRVLVLEQLLGATRVLTRELGAGILARRALPAPLPL